MGSPSFPPVRKGETTLLPVLTRDEGQQATYELAEYLEATYPNLNVRCLMLGSHSEDQQEFTARTTDRVEFIPVPFHLSPSSFTFQTEILLESLRHSARGGQDTVVIIHSFNELVKAAWTQWGEEEAVRKLLHISDMAVDFDEWLRGSLTIVGTLLKDGRTAFDREVYLVLSRLISRGRPVFLTEVAGMLKVAEKPRSGSDTIIP